jgi:peptidoglycan/LPS O-acetylase OafA/YrhL
MSEKPQHIAAIVGLRGLAALMVVLFHFVVKTVDFIHDERVLHIFGFFDLGVQIFFVISGIVIPFSLIKSNYRITQIGTFLLKRCARIEPPYLITVGLAFAYIYARQMLPGTTPSDYRPGGWDLLLHLGYLVPFVEGARWLSEVFWTLAIEFQYYLLIALTMPLLLLPKAIWRWTFFILFAGASYLPFGDRQLLYWSPLFLCGILYALKYLQTISLREYLFAAPICLLFVLHKMGPENFCAALFTLMVVWIWPHFRSKVSDFFGSISYSIYLLHTITGGAVVNILSHRVHAPWQKCMVILAGVVFAVLASYIFYRIVELPSQRWSQRLKYKSS